MDGLFDARKVPLAQGPQHLILSDADQGLLRGRDDHVAAAAAALRRVRTRHVTLSNTSRVGKSDSKVLPPR